MDILLEAIIEIFGEIFFEIILCGIGSLIDRLFFDYAFSPEKKKKIVRIIIYGLLSTAVLVLLFICIAYGKTIFTIATSIFILVNTIASIVGKILKKYNMKNTYRIILRSFQEAFKIVYVTFLFANANSIQSDFGRGWLIALTCVGIIICLGVDCYKIYKLTHKPDTTEIEDDTEKSPC